MGYYLADVRQYETLKVTRKYTLLRLNKCKGRMLSEHLRCCNFILQWFMDLLDFGTKRLCCTS